MAQRKYDVAAYIWPSYTGDEPRAYQFWEQRLGEWQTVMDPTKKPEWEYSGAAPLWGYVNEADPQVMERQIDAAAEHGLNVFIYDWYWYDGRPFLEQCLDRGFLQAKNRQKMKFYIMWANHNATYLWDKRNSDCESTVWSGAVSVSEFDRVCDRIIEMYFKHPLYYKIDGRPVFMIYDVANLIYGLGGVENTQRCLAHFRRKVCEAGFEGLELQLCAWSERAVDLARVDAAYTGGTKRTAELLGFNSLTNYQFVQLTNIDRCYTDVLSDIKQVWHMYDREYTIPYYPHVSVGWDNNLRHRHFVPGIIKNNTPENFEKALLEAKSYLDSHPDRVPLVTVNSWNEWTEGSYLEPDTLHGYGYLEAIKHVFCVN